MEVAFLWLAPNESTIEHSDQPAFDGRSQPSGLCRSRMALVHHHCAHAKRTRGQKSRKRLPGCIAWQETNLDTETLQFAAHVPIHDRKRQFFGNRTRTERNKSLVIRSPAPIIIFSAICHFNSMNANWPG